MILDVFLYAGERDMAELRVQTMRDHVDTMVAVSCNLTHQSKLAHNYPPPSGCEWVIVEADPIPDGRGGHGTHWYQWIERQHRDGMRQAVVGASARDLVLISDVDEIPDPTRLGELEKVAQETPVAIPMRMHGFALDYLYPRPWRGTTASLVCDLAPQAHRDWRHRLPEAGGGWHLSWMGDLDEKRRKLESFSHAELADLDLEDCYRNARHANGEQLIRIDPDDYFWPAPMFDTFTPPPSWWAPKEG